ncbi:DNA-directed RNA polymerase subunit omega [Campylobacter troglodytis]|uniref:DNA-directed RNA polymerase subunit omega n=1 Tax=Campylobacter troglodytis TaxID=654363 RepID=UPI001156F764|nr:DNA-directed RNA polymerase subunit omega [Campylobacter troglodytis]TQR60316.1 DNA-directed RNA polymerase subunit omega [Campylobacter troglodytis]
MEERMEKIAARALANMNNDRYKLSLAIAKRAEELANGATPLVDLDKSRIKLADIALIEVAENKLSLDDGIERT